MKRFEVRCGDGSLANYIYDVSLEAAQRQLAVEKRDKMSYWHGWKQRLYVVEP